MKNIKKGLRPCTRCQRGIGSFVYESDEVEGEFDTSECYVAQLMDNRGWSRELEPELDPLTPLDTLC